MNDKPMYIDWSHTECNKYDYDQLNTAIRAGWQDNVLQKSTQINSKSTHTDRDSQAVSDILHVTTMKKKPMRKKTKITTRGDKNSAFD